MWLKFLIIFLLFTLFQPSSNLFAVENPQYITIVNPIRGKDFWNNKFDTLDTPSKQYSIIKDNNISATWLVRYDALIDPNTQNFLKTLNSKQEVGIFMEITPTLTEDAGVVYNQGKSWHSAGTILLTGYSVDDRKKLIDVTFEKYKQIYGKYPKSIGAWWIDAGSLTYMQQKYGIVANLDVADQFSTDQYQVWGQYFSLPFYPSKFNALVPAQSIDQKIGVTTIQWATRDPYNSYGYGEYESTYSVQANDYMLHKLNVDYFLKLLKIYPQVTIGIENNFDFEKYGIEYKNQIEAVIKIKSTKIQTMSEFSETYKKQNPTISPNELIIAKNPLGGDFQAIWYQTPRYRVGLFYGPYGLAIRDLREYRPSKEEPCLKTACKELNFASSFDKAIDEVSFKKRWTLDEGKITGLKVEQKFKEVIITYNNQAGIDKTIRLLENDIEANGKIQPISFAISNIDEIIVGQKGEDLSYFITNQDYLNNLGSLLLSSVKFFIFTLIFIFVPGFLLTKRILLSIPTGWVLFTFLSYVFGIFKIDIIIWLLPLLMLFIKYKTLKPSLSANKKILPGILLIIIGSISWLVTIFRSGWQYSFGLGFWGPNAHDAIWHLSLIESLKESVPPNNPIFAGEKLTNYHYFFNLLVARTSEIFNIDVLDLLFRLYPLLFSILSGVLIYSFVYKISNKHLAAFFSTFYLYFGGSFGWLVNYFKEGSFGGESLFWSQQSVSTLLNLPFAISIVLFLAGLLIYEKLLKGEVIKWQILSLVLLWGTLIEFKAYGGVLVLVAFSLITIERFLIHKDYKLLFIFLLNLLIAAFVFLPNNVFGVSLFVFRPFWFIETMIDFQDRLNNIRLSLMIHSENVTKVVLAHLIGITIFLFGNFGTRFIGFFTNQLSVQRFLVYIFAFGIILPMFFIQTGTNWNSVQFFYYSLLVLNIFAGIGLANVVIKFKIVGWVIALLIILLTIPTTIDTFKHYLPNRPPAKISHAEQEALKFLSKQTDGVVLSLAYNENIKKIQTEPYPLYAYAPTAYISAFSGKKEFISDTINLDILGVNYKGRLNEQKDFIVTPDRSKDLLKRNDISYVYLIKKLGYDLDEGKLGIKKIFENNEVSIYKSI